MTKGTKKQLSQHVESIFKGYVTPGLHVCDLATGGGKSYTISKLTCKYYPEYFDRIIILCVQNKLVNGIWDEINKCLSTGNGKINPKDVLVVENNLEVAQKAVTSGAFELLIHQMENLSEKFDGLDPSLKAARDEYNIFKSIIQAKSTANDYLEKQLNDSEFKLRSAVRQFFRTYKALLDKQKKSPLPVNRILALCPSLAEVYPQVEIKNKRVLLMTVHKAFYGIDPVLFEKMSLLDLTEGHRSLVIFDESDQAAVAMRDVIIEQAIDKSEGDKRFAKGYTGFLSYNEILHSEAEMSVDYFKELLSRAFAEALEKTEKNWSVLLDDTKPYKSIFLDKNESLESYRHGVFFSGRSFRVNVGKTNDNSRSFICYKSGDRDFKLVHAQTAENLKANYDIVVKLDRFLDMAVDNSNEIKRQLCWVASEALKVSRKRFDEEISAIKSSGKSSENYFGYPTIEREIHTLVSRFEIRFENEVKAQLKEYLENQTSNLKFKTDKSVEMTDRNVYTEGVQLYLEEVDPLDNQHRIRLSCREISTTPEKIICDLVLGGDISVVLCSATASSKTVISNFDLGYLSRVLGNKFMPLTRADWEKFDKLLSELRSPEHKIEVAEVAEFKPDTILAKLTCPDRYRNMFSEAARKEGLPDKWLRQVIRLFKGQKEKDSDVVFELYRIFQFIEVYHWFVSHPDIQSMLYFQNRLADKEAPILNALACLIDGSFTQMPSEWDDEIPQDWVNSNLAITKEAEEVNLNILIKLQADKNTRVMLVAAYGSFKAGSNLQYNIPSGSDCLVGDNWTSDNSAWKKDWDAIYVQAPTAYLLMNESAFERGLYNIMLKLMMFYENGYISRSEVASWINRALSGNFIFSADTIDDGILLDKTSWVQSTVEQAVGRICRTCNKTRTTYILYDEKLRPYFREVNRNKSMTDEYRALIASIAKAGNFDDSQDADHATVAMANYAKKELERIRTNALKHLPHPYDDDDAFDETTEVSWRVADSQVWIQAFKSEILRHPTISSVGIALGSELLSKCYGRWMRDDNGSVVYYTDKRGRLTTLKNGHSHWVSPETVRLTVMMKNPAIRSHFERNGYATDWKAGELTLHPLVLASDYAGEIGEEAFMAIVLAHTDCPEDRIKHLEGKLYEYADFVIVDESGKPIVAFDVKNMDPSNLHTDAKGDMDTHTKRELKEQRLGCKIVTVNIVDITDPLADEISEIGGLIDNNGNVIPSAIERIQKLIKL